MLVGGMRALLVQALEPRAMAAVDQHSAFREDPWGRLERTTRFVLDTTYGDTPTAEAAAARVRGVHRRIHGVDPQDFDGTFDSHVEAIHPDDRDRIRAALQASVRDGTAFDVIAAQLVKPGTGVPGVQSAATTVRALPGERPFAATAQETRMTVKVYDVDTISNIVEVVGPSGYNRRVKVMDPKAREFIRGLKPGDQVEVTITEAAAISVQPAK